jgi:hypothetical protein
MLKEKIQIRPVREKGVVGRSEVKVLVIEEGGVAF